MTGLCGWIGQVGTQTEARSVLDNMASHLDGHSQRTLHATISDCFAVAVVGDPQNAGIFTDGPLTAALSGDVIWQSRELHRLAADQGHAATLVRCYQRYGNDVLQSLHGPFSAVIIDANEGSFVLAIDRLGIKTMYHAHTGEASVFGSRADCITEFPQISSTIDPQAVFDYLYFHMVPSPRVIYCGLEKLLPGQYVKISAGKLEKDFYWHIPYDDHSRMPLAALKDRFHEVLSNSVSRSANNATTGCFLSGGTDSSTVAGKLMQVTGEPANTYSIGFDASGFDEMEYARIAGKHFGVTPHEYYVTPDDVVNAIPLIARSYDEPFGNASAIPTYYCAKLAADDGITTMLAGDGGDEIFAGNARYANQKIFEFYSRLPPLLRTILIEPVVSNLPGASHITPLRKLQSYINQARMPMPDRMETYNFLHRTMLEEIFSRDFLHAIDAEEPLNNIREVYFRARSDSMLHCMLHLDMKITLADNDLRKVSRMCEVAGVKARYPLLDEEMVEFAAGVPPDLKLKGSQLRWFFKNALTDFLPPEIITKSKHGFGLPFGIWLNTHPPLRELAYDSLQSLQKRNYLRPGYIDWLVEQHRGGHASYYGVMIWVLMMLEQWFASHGK